MDNNNILLRIIKEDLGEGNGNPLQCSCLENPRDGGAWWAAVYGVAESDMTEATWQQQHMNKQEASWKRITKSQTQAMKYAVLCNNIQICRKQIERIRLIRCVRHRQAPCGTCQTGDVGRSPACEHRKGRKDQARTEYLWSLLNFCSCLPHSSPSPVHRPDSLQYTKCPWTCEALGTHEV